MSYIGDFGRCSSCGETIRLLPQFCATYNELGRRPPMVICECGAEFPADAARCPACRKRNETGGP